MLKFIEILNIPRVVATVHRAEDVEFLSKGELSGICDLLEFRLDSLRECLDQAEEAIRAVSPDCPCLITARDPAEGGAGDLGPEERIALLRRFLPHAACIDVEVGSIGDSAGAGLITEAHQAGAAVIASFHDFTQTPEMPKLLKALTTVKESGADVIKVATRLRGFADLARLVEFTEEAARERILISAMGMGSLGKLSRLTLAMAGSCLNYGYLQEANAPGQWPAEELLRLFGELGLR